MKFSSLILLLFFDLLNDYHVYGQQQPDQSRIIDCGIEYLPNTIGLSIVGDQIYQIIKKNDILQIIIYNNKQKRLKGRSKKQIENDDNNQKIINYKMDLSNGYIYYFDEQIIIEKNIHKLLFDELYYEHDPNNDEQIIKTEKLSEKFNAIIIITNNNNDNDKNQIKFILYETSYLPKHFVIVYDSSQTNETKQLQKFIMSFENIPAEMIVISDNELSIVISYIMTANAITIETIMEEPILKFFLYLNYSQPEKFVSSNERLTIPELSEESEHSRINIQNVFVQHKFRYGFIEKFSFPTTSVIIDDNGNRKTMNEEEYIAFLFSNEKKKLLTFNIGDVMLKEQNVVSYFHYNYKDFFHCNDSLSKKENKNKNKDKNDDNKNDDHHHHQDNVTEKILTTTTTKNDNSVKSKSTTIIIYISIIIIIIISSIILINSCNNSNNNNSKQKKLQQPNSTSSSTSSITSKKTREKKKLSKNLQQKI